MIQYGRSLPKKKQIEMMMMKPKRCEIGCRDSPRLRNDMYTETVAQIHKEIQITDLRLKSPGGCMIRAMDEIKNNIMIAQDMFNWNMKLECSLKGHF